MYSTVQNIMCYSDLSYNTIYHVSNEISIKWCFFFKAFSVINTTLKLFGDNQTSAWSVISFITLTLYTIAVIILSFVLSTYVNADNILSSVADITYIIYTYIIIWLLLYIIFMDNSVTTIMAGKNNNMVDLRPKTGRKWPVEFTTCKIYLFWDASSMQPIISIPKLNNPFVSLTSHRPVSY